MHKQKLPTWEERWKSGIKRRSRYPRSKHGDCKFARRTSDFLELLKAADEGKPKELLAIKYSRMSTSPFAFYRGAVPVMAHDLAAHGACGIRAQICGDAHVRNLGFYIAPDGRIIFDLNDFDETAPGPFEWDIKRLAVSLVIAGREAGTNDRDCEAGVRHFVMSYANSMHTFARMPTLSIARFQVHRPRATPLTEAMRSARHAPASEVARRLMRPGSNHFRDEAKLMWHPPARERAHVLEALVQYRETLAPERARILDFYTPADVIFRVVGTGSVGNFDYLVLMLGKNDDDIMILQVKQARESAYAAWAPKQLSRINQGRRIVEGQRAMQAQSDLLLGWTAFDGRDYLVRQYKDYNASVDLRQLKGKGLQQSAEFFGEVLAKAHARSGDPCQIAGYLGKGAKFTDAIARFSFAYADQVDKDFKQFLKSKLVLTARRARA